MTHRPAPPLTPALVRDTPRDRLRTINLAAIAACDHDLARRVAAASTTIPAPGSKMLGGELTVSVHPSSSGWPTLSAGPLHIHSAYDPISEAEVQAQRVPAEAEVVQALGFGAGTLLAVLLGRAALRRLDVVIMNPGVLLAVASAVDLRPLLCDPRVRLSLPEKQRLRSPFAPVPPLLLLAESGGQELCSAAQDALATEAQRLHEAQQHPRWLALLSQRRQQAPAPGVHLLADRHPRSLALVVAAGPSLAEQLQQLRGPLGAVRRHDPAAVPLIAEEAALPALIAEGFLPDYVVALGMDATSSPALSSPLPPAVTLVYGPLVPDSWLASFRGQRFQAALTGHPFLMAQAAALASPPEDGLFAEGGVLTAALSLAQLIGATQTVLIGAALGTPAPTTGGPIEPWRRSCLAVSGQPLLVNGAQLTTRLGIEALLRRHPGYVIHQTSSDGARIAGTQETPLPLILRTLSLLAENHS